MEKVILEIQQPYSAVTQRVVVPSTPVIVGRGYHCDVILDDPYVSEEHLEIISLSDGRLRVVDRGSVNGVFVGLQKISDRSCIIESGQEIKVGHTHIKLFTPRHAVQSARLHDRLSSLQRFIDRRHVGAILSMLCVAVGVWLVGLTEVNNPDYWHSDVYGVGISIFLLIGIVWSTLHMSLVIFSKKHMPWPRIVSYASVILLAFMAFSMLVTPYVYFYLLADWQVLAVTAGLLFAFLLASEYGLRVICELPLKPFNIVSYAMVVAALFAIAASDIGYNGTPVFPQAVITADLPLSGTQPLDIFIGQALDRHIR